MINSLYGDLIRELIDYTYDQTKIKKNKKKIKCIIESVTTILFEHFKPYFYTIFALLIIMFIINMFQFYYYIKQFISKTQFQNIITSI